MKNNRSKIHALMSPAQKKLLLVSSLARELSLEGNRQIKNILQMISHYPTDTEIVNEATDAALAIMRALPEFRNTLFDQNPLRYPRGRAAGPIVFAREFNPIVGRVYLVGLALIELLQNIIITGRAGAGKTTAIYAIIRSLHRLGIPFWWIDFKQDGRALTKDHKRPCCAST